MDFFCYVIPASADAGPSFLRLLRSADSRRPEALVPEERGMLGPGQQTRGYRNSLSFAPRRGAARRNESSIEHPVVILLRSSGAHGFLLLRDPGVC